MSTDDRPLVTVTDPARRPVPTDVIGAEARAHRRRWPYAAVSAALVAAALVLPVLDRRADDADAAEQRRLGGVVALALDDRIALRDTGGPRLSTRATLLTLDLTVRNDGPLPVVVDRAVVGDFRFLGDVDLGPGESEQLQLVRTVTCLPDAAQPPLDPLGEGLRLQVVTRAGPRSVLVGPAGTLPLERLRTSARRACGYLPVEDAVSYAVTTRAADGGVLTVLELSNDSARALSLDEVRLPAGLRAVEPAALPRDLPPGPARVRVSLLVEADCEAAPRAVDGSLLPLPRPPLQVVVATGASRVGPLPPERADVEALERAYLLACS